MILIDILLFVFNILTAQWEEEKNEQCSYWILAIDIEVTLSKIESWIIFSEYLRNKKNKILLKETSSCGGRPQGGGEKTLQESDVGDDSSDEELYEVCDDDDGVDEKDNDDADVSDVADDDIGTGSSNEARKNNEKHTRHN